MTQNNLTRGYRLAQAATATLILFAVTAPASAIERFRSDTQSCAIVQRTLDNAGAAVIQYPSQNIANYLLYDRYVSSDAHCEADERAVPATVIAADTLECGVKRCLPHGVKAKQTGGGGGLSTPGSLTTDPGRPAF